MKMKIEYLEDNWIRFIAEDKKDAMQLGRLSCKIYGTATISNEPTFEFDFHILLNQDNKLK